MKQMKLPGSKKCLAFSTLFITSLELPQRPPVIPLIKPSHKEKCCEYSTFYEMMMIIGGGILFVMTGFHKKKLVCSRAMHE